VKLCKKIFSVVLVIALFYAVIGCGSNSSYSQAVAATDRPVKIGVSMSTTQNLFYSKMAQIIENHCKERGIACVISDENNDVNKQISSFENFIASGCTAIIAVVFNGDGIKDVVKKAVDSGIFVMTYDGFVEGAQGSLNLDNYVYGYQTGTMAADWVNSNPELKNQQVIEAGIFDYPDIPIIIDRAKGIADALAEKAPNVKVVAQQKAGIGDEGNVQGENFLAAHPNIQIICGINDTGVLGAYEVFKAAGHIGDNIGLFGADGDPQALRLIADGVCYRGTVKSGAYEALPKAVDVCIAASKGEKVEGNMIYETVPVTKANVEDFLQDAQ
jgi:ribose transport system substrate-binding protein